MDVLERTIHYLVLLEPIIQGCLGGKSHSDETPRTYASRGIRTGRAKMSDALTGANNPMYGKVAANAMTINSRRLFY